MFRFDRLTVTPRMPAEALRRIADGRRVALHGAEVWLLPVRWAEEDWALFATAREGAVRRLELRMAGRPGGLEETCAAQNALLTEQLGDGFTRGLGRRTYRFGWGSVRSLLDGKTGECLILVEYD